MTTITNLTTTDLQERMGDATHADADCMMAILSRECVTDTDDVNDSQWLKWCEEATDRAAREASE